MIGVHNVLLIDLFSRNNKGRGFTLFEVLIVISITLALGTLVISTFTDFHARKSRDAATEEVLSMLSRAHLDTITAKNDLVYGVELRATYYLLFSGNTPPASDLDPRVIRKKALPSGVEIANIALSGGGSDIYFQRLTGATDQNGSFDVRVQNRTYIFTTINMSKTGAVSI